jgi:hypothetical protein
MMGPSHAMSGAAVWLTGSAIFSTTTGNPPSIPLLIMGTVIMAGAALGPDLDSHGSTVVRSFGIFGTLFYNLVNMVSLFFYNLTKTRYDGDKTNGHRTLFHTGVMAIVAGGLTSLATLSTGTVTILEQDYIWGQFFGLIIMGLFLNLALAGLFEPIRQARKKVGPYIMMLASVLITFGFAYFVPEANDTYAWLGFAVGGGWFVHLLGDLITKMGVPILWFIKIKGKRWYDVSLPSFLRITAGGTVEKVALVPLFIITIIGAAVWNGHLITTMGGF